MRYELMWFGHWCIQWEVSRGSKLFLTAHTLHLYHQSEYTSRIASWTYLSISIMSTNASQPKHTHAKAFKCELEYKSVFALWPLNMPHSGRCKWMNWICVYWLLYCACVMVKWGRQWWSLILRIFHSIPFRFVCLFVPIFSSSVRKMLL